MRGKIVKVIAFIVAVVIALGFVGTARATLVDSNSIVQDDIEYYIQTNKVIYDLGENVEMLYTVTNLGEVDVTIYCSKVPEFNLWVQKEEETIWALYHWFLSSSPGVELAVGESIELIYVWDMKDDNGNLVELGTYNVVGVMYNQPWNDYNHGNPIITEVGVPITIVPEPGSLALLITGSTILHYFNKKKRRVTR